MKFYRAVTIALVNTCALAQQQQASVSGTPSSSASSGLPSATMTPQDACALKCNPEDVACKAKCLGVPNPSANDIKKYNECAAECNNNPPAAQPACLKNCSPLYSSATVSSSAASSSGSGSGSNSTNSTNGSLNGANSSASTNSLSSPTFFLISSFTVGFFALTTL